MLAIRLQRTGSKKRPFFRVVLIESRAARDSRFVEALGHYDPRARPERFVVDRERLETWVRQGARLSSTVRTLLARQATTGAESEPAPVEGSA